jgi:uncharacterized membrane protein
MAEAHANSRLETFCDGVFAIALTLLVLEIKVPAHDGIGTTRELWTALGHLGAPLSALVLSFVIILITWVNHHRFFRLVDQSSGSFVYANGFLLLTVVIMPFPTALVGEYLLTDHAAPAVIIYNSVAAAQAIGWILVAVTGLRLAKDEKCAMRVREGGRSASMAFVVYSLLAVVAIWFPLTIAVVTTLLWAYWLAFSLRQTNA